MNYKRIIILIMLICPGFFTICLGQQNHSMYLMHYLPESNLLNPAVPISCKWYIGLPVLSSVHFNYSNSSFTYNQAFPQNPDGTYQANVDGVVNQMHWRNFIGTEIHLQLFALAYRPGDYSFMFTISEKNNIPVTYPKELMQLAWNGNTQFEGENANLRGTAIYFNHYREYALSVSKRTSDGIFFGARAKLLFGKLNIAPRKTNVGLSTDDITFNLDMEGKVLWHTSAPIIVDTSGGTIAGIAFDESASYMNLIFNRQNPGFGIDAGVIYPINDQIELSASVIDLGFIRWRSYLNTFEGQGSLFFDGIWGDGVDDENYFDELISSVVDSLDFQISQKKYTTMLPTRILGGAKYTISEKLNAGLQAEGIFHKSKVIPSLTISTNWEPLRNIHLMASYTIQSYSFNNLGAGLVLGRNPVQFYIISDNVPGLIWPLSARNINFRFGLNINLGCRQKDEEDNKSGGGRSSGNSSGAKAYGGKKSVGGKYKQSRVHGSCYWAEKEVQKEYQKRKTKRRKK